jgi:hypothetical protein
MIHLPKPVKPRNMIVTCLRCNRNYFYALGEKRDCVNCKDATNMSGSQEFLFCVRFANLGYCTTCRTIYNGSLDEHGVNPCCANINAKMIYETDFKWLTEVHSKAV